MRKLPILLGGVATAVACSTTTSTVAPAPPTVTVQASPTTTFASISSDRVRKAALVYPPAEQMQPSAPLSLTASDGTGLSLMSYKAKAVVDGPLAFTELHLKFRNPRPETIEGRFSIRLPEDASVSRLAMLIDGGWQEAEVVELQQARRAYEDFLHRKQDPALLEKQAGNEFSARIFPIPGNGTKDIIISYAEPLRDSEGSYRLMLQGLPQIDSLSIQAQVGSAAAGQAMQYKTTQLERKGWKPNRDFEVSLGSAPAAIRAGAYAAFRIRPQVATAARDFASIAIVVDTSASRAPGFAAQVRKLGETIAALKAAQSSRLQLVVATYDHEVTPVFSGSIADFGQSHLDAIRSHRPLGASNMLAALQWLRSAGVERAVFVTDGIATLGDTSEGTLGRATKALRAITKRIDIIAVGGIRDRDAMTEIARGALERDGAIIDSELAPSVIAKKLRSATVSDLEVHVKNAKWVYPNRLDGVQAGDEFVVHAFVPSLKTTAPLTVSISDLQRSSVEAATQTFTLPASRAPSPLVRRSAARAEIAMLSSKLTTLPPRDTAARKRLQDTITQLSIKNRIVSDYTALLVLETEADYQRFKIPRNALVDILRVGKRGVEVFHRPAPVIAKPNPTPRIERLKKSEDKAKEKVGTKADLANVAKDISLKRVANRRQRDVVRESAEEDARSNFAGASRLEPTYHTSDDSPAEPLRRQQAQIPRPRPAAEQELSRGPATTGAGRSVGQLRGGGNAGASTQDGKKFSGPAPLTGELARIMSMIKAGQNDDALVAALTWRTKEAGNVLALIALGEALEARGDIKLAARAYGSIIDLFPARADMRRFAGQRLERLGTDGNTVAMDSYRKAVADRPDHLTGHRLLGYALLQAEKPADAFAAIEAGLARNYPSGRFDGGKRILREDLGIIAAVWLHKQPSATADINKRLKAAGAALATQPSLRFVVNWETDANDVDFHIWDGKGNHAYYSKKQLASGGELYADVTNGYGPECFTIPGKAAAFPYQLKMHYYSRGPMGYGMGKVSIMRFDGKSQVDIENRPFVVMQDRAYLDMGTVTARQ